mmetsp:Transcript_9112/g.33259  ORF Transcript_9112/g.33259 Transcript_9112/m.33259 type:complete len:484 (+) Transcript_9112:974-2425(+)
MQDDAVAAEAHDEIHPRVLRRRRRVSPNDPREGVRHALHVLQHQVSDRGRAEGRPGRAVRAPRTRRARRRRPTRRVPRRLLLPHLPDDVLLHDNLEPHGQHRVRHLHELRQQRGAELLQHEYPLRRFTPHQHQLLRARVRNFQHPVLNLFARAREPVRAYDVHVRRLLQAARGRGLRLGRRRGLRADAAAAHALAAGHERRRRRRRDSSVDRVHLLRLRDVEEPGALVRRARALHDHALDDRRGGVAFLLRQAIRERSHERLLRDASKVAAQRLERERLVDVHAAGNSPTRHHAPRSPDAGFAVHEHRSPRSVVRHLDESLHELERRRLHVRHRHVDDLEAGIVRESRRAFSDADAASERLRPLVVSVLEAQVDHGLEPSLREPRAAFRGGLSAAVERDLGLDLAVVVDRVLGRVREDVRKRVDAKVLMHGLEVRNRRRVRRVRRAHLRVAHVQRRAPQRLELMPHGQRAVAAVFRLPLERDA